LEQTLLVLAVDKPPTFIYSGGSLDIGSLDGDDDSMRGSGMDGSI